MRAGQSLHQQQCRFAAGLDSGLAGAVAQAAPHRRLWVAAPGPDRDLMVLVRAALHDVADATVADDLRDDVVAQGPESPPCRPRWPGCCNGGELRVGHRLHEGEDLEGSVDEARTQEVVDALRPGGAGAWRVIPRVREFENGSVAVVGRADLVGGLPRKSRWQSCC